MSPVEWAFDLLASLVNPWLNFMVLISAMYFCVVWLNLRSVFLFLWEYGDIYVTLIACGLFRSIRFVWYFLPNFLSVEPLFVCLGGHLFDTVGLYLFCSHFTILCRFSFIYAFVCFGGHLFETIGQYLFRSYFTNSLSVQFYLCVAFAPGLVMVESMLMGGIRSNKGFMR